MKYCVSSVVVESVTFSDIVMLYEQVRTCRLYLNNSRKAGYYTVYRDKFGSREVGKKSEFPTFRFSIVTGLRPNFFREIENIILRKKKIP